MNNMKIKTFPKMGRGVVATSPFKKGQCVMICPVIVIPKKDVKSIEATILDHYIYSWAKGCSAVALGYGSLLNHSSEPNIEASYDEKTQTMHYHALRNIKANEQLFINYGYKI